MGGLERLLSGEDQVSDLVAFLAQLDHVPLARLLELGDASLTVTREKFFTDSDTGEEGRLDLLVLDQQSKQPRALLEVKIGAGQHGEQYGLYGKWALERGIAEHCWLAALAGVDTDVPPAWRTLRLSELVGAWLESSHPHAAWLSACAANVIARREAQFDGLLGEADDIVVADLVVKKLKADLSRDPYFERIGAELWPGMRTMGGGTPMVMVSVPLPNRDGATDVAMTLDLRGGTKDVRPRRWILRLGVEVEVTAERPRSAARALAHDLAIPVAHKLTRTAFIASLPAGAERLLNALPVGSRGWRDGLKGAPGAARLDEWREAASAGGEPGGHPLLFHDGDCAWRRSSPLTPPASTTAGCVHSSRRRCGTSLMSRWTCRPR
jgi:hypothetical protein